jgi:hypothetical protein
MRVWQFGQFVKVSTFICNPQAGQATCSMFVRSLVVMMGGRVPASTQPLHLMIVHVKNTHTG